MKRHVNLKHAAACIAAILPIAMFAVTVSVHGAFAIQYPHHAPGLSINTDLHFIHHAASGREGHLIGWINHLVGPFTSIAANF